MTTKYSKAHDLNEDIKRRARECKLDAWNAFVDPVNLPGDLYAALLTGRPELLKLVQPRALSATEAKSLYAIIATLIATNAALQEHASQVAHFTDRWADAFKHLRGVGDRLQRFANFEHTDQEEELE